MDGWSSEVRSRWNRQLRNRALVLEGLDRYLAVDEQARLENKVTLTDFIPGLLDALTDICHIANQTRALPQAEKAPLTIESLEGLAVVAAEITHYLASRGHPVVLSDFVRIGQEQRYLREQHEKHPDPDADSDA